MKKEDDENTDNTYLSPSDFADRVMDKKQFILTVWDSNKFRFGQRIQELLLRGYAPVGSPFTQRIYEEVGAEGGYRQPKKDDICLLMYNKELHTKVANDA